MSLGEIPGSTVLDAYYHLEDLNDASGNSRTLTNKNTVSFGVGKFTNGADFGSSGTNKALWYTGGNIFSTTTPTNVTISFWYRLNNTASATPNSNFVVVNTNTSATTGSLYNVIYSITGSNITITAINYKLSGDNTVSLAFTTDSNWHHVYVVCVGRSVSLTVDRYLNADSGATGTPRSVIDANNAYVSIGNSRLLTTQAWATIDELIISEDYLAGDTAFQRTNRFNYYTQAKGRFCI